MAWDFGLIMNILGVFHMKPKMNVIEGAIVEDAPAKPAKAETVERRILRDFADRLNAARQRVSESAETVARLEAIVQEGERASDVLQTSIERDGLEALDADSPAMRATIAAEVRSRTAERALPGARAAAETAKADAMRLDGERNIAATNALRVQADRVAARYMRAWRELCDLHDRLLGLSPALPPLTRMGEAIHNLTVPFEVPRFNLPSTTPGGGGYSPSFRHIPSVDYSIPPVTARWSRALDCLLDDPDADISDLIAEDIA